MGLRGLILKWLRVKVRVKEIYIYIYLRVVLNLHLIIVSCQEVDSCKKKSTIREVGFTNFFIGSGSCFTMLELYCMEDVCLGLNGRKV